MKIDEFVSELNKIDVNISDDKLEKLNKYYELLVNWNNKFNLTSITEKESVYLKHFYDSICIVKTNLIKDNSTLCDIGTGAGFPGIVISIFFPKMKITLLESNKKKCEFLNEVKKELKLDNIIIENQRAEIYGKKVREEYNLITCRAVSQLRILLELSAPLLKKGGYFIPLKGNIENEIKDSKSTLKKLNLKVEKYISYNLPVENSVRNIPLVKKLDNTPLIYPREYKKILNKPL